MPRIAALVLAAGQSQRMGPRNKLLAEIRGKAMIRHVVETALASKAKSVCVVTGHEATQVEQAIGMLDVDVIRNPDYTDGLSTSLAIGIDAIAKHARFEGAIVMLGDMPGVTSQQLDRLIAAFNPDEDRAICLPCIAGRRRNPVLFARRFFKAMGEFVGDVGARQLIGANEKFVCDVVFEDETSFEDIDTPLALASYEETHQ